MSKIAFITLGILSTAFTNAVATPMYCSASVQNAQPITTKIHKVIQKTLSQQCKTKSCKKNVHSFVAGLPLYPVILNVEDLTFKNIPYVDRYHTSICYERAEGQVPVCDQLFPSVDQPNLLEDKLRLNFTQSKFKIKKLRSFEGRTKGENWLVADLSPFHLPQGTVIKLHLALFATQDIAFLKKAKKRLATTLSGLDVTIGEVSCRMGKY